MQSNDNDKLKQMALEMIFQITDENVPEEKQCEEQGDSNYQIAMYYLRKAYTLNESKKQLPLYTLEMMSTVATYMSQNHEGIDITPLITEMATKGLEVAENK